MQKAFQQMYNISQISHGLNVRKLKLCGSKIITKIVKKNRPRNDVPKMVQKLSEIDGELVQHWSKIDQNSIQTIKMVKGRLQEAPRKHFGGSWKGSRGSVRVPQDLVGAPGLPERRLKFPYNSL